MHTPRKIIVFIAQSLDGYIAREDGSLDWLDSVQREGEDYGYEAFVSNTDTVLMGRKTYEKVLSFGVEFPHKNRNTYVITRQPQISEGNIHFYSGDLSQLIEQIRKTPGKNIFVDGGAELILGLLQENLIDEWIISIIPKLIGGGISLFKSGFPGQDLTLVSVKHFESGLVQLHYTGKGIQ